MAVPRQIACALLFLLLQTPGQGTGSKAQPASAGIATSLAGLSVDAEHTWRVRNLQLVRGDIKIYLTEGVLGFLTPVEGRIIGAVYSTRQAEAGDAEVILLPPARSERASLASYTGSANLNEHFGTALFMFSDATADDLLHQIQANSASPVPELAGDLAAETQSAARSLADLMNVRLTQSLRDRHTPANGFFFALIAGRQLGNFHVAYNPSEPEPVSAGRVTGSGSDESHPKPERYELWTTFRPKRMPAPEAAATRLSRYRIDITIRPDMSLDVNARFDLKSDPADGRVVSLRLTPHLKASAASIDGQPVEILQRSLDQSDQFETSDALLLIAPSDLNPGVTHRVEVHYSGSVIRQNPNGDYLVEERARWYPIGDRVSADFDLTFHCSSSLRLVSTGELVEESVAGGIRTVHRKTAVPAALAGFNLGHYTVESGQTHPYQIAVYHPEFMKSPGENLSAETAGILSSYTGLWGPLPIHSLAVTPVSGYFGQGFPGLIYLSNITYLSEKERPAALRNPRFDAFFTDLLLPHEIAHQWWGNILRQADYRTGWLTEAMANDAALDYISQTKGGKSRNEILDSYRDDLLQDHQGKTLESAGPVDFGERLLNTDGLLVWHVITYEKGAWILRMLRERLGEQSYLNLQRNLLRDFASAPVSNDDFRQEAARLIPAGQPDRTLTAFFDTWVYNTGIPHLSLHKSSRAVEVQVSSVDQDFEADIPLRCGAKGGPERTHWLRVGAGANSLDLKAGETGCQLPDPNRFLYIPASH